MADLARSEQRLLRRLPHWREERPLTSEDSSSRIAAFVYGNILVLAALLALRPEDLLGPKAIAYVLGTGLSTFLAHVVAESVGSRVRLKGRNGGGLLRHVVLDAVPIASSTLTPAVLMLTALLGWIDPTVGLLMALAVTVLRLAGLGWVVGRLRQEPATFRTLLAGILLAVVCVGVSVLKWWLTH